MAIKVALAGAGAFGIKHLDGIKLIDGVEVVSLVSRDLEKTKEVASRYGITPARISDVLPTFGFPVKYNTGGGPVSNRLTIRRVRLFLPRNQAF